MPVESLKIAPQVAQVHKYRPLFDVYGERKCLYIEILLFAYLDALIVIGMKGLVS